MNTCALPDLYCKARSNAGFRRLNSPYSRLCSNFVCRFVISSRLSTFGLFEGSNIFKVENFTAKFYLKKSRAWHVPILAKGFFLHFKIIINDLSPFALRNEPSPSASRHKPRAVSVSFVENFGDVRWNVNFIVKIVCAAFERSWSRILAWKKISSKIWQFWKGQIFMPTNNVVYISTKVAILQLFLSVISEENSVSFYWWPPRPIRYCCLLVAVKCI